MARPPQTRAKDTARLTFDDTLTGDALIQEVRRVRVEVEKQARETLKQYADALSGQLDKQFVAREKIDQGLNAGRKAGVKKRQQEKEKNRLSYTRLLNRLY